MQLEVDHEGMVRQNHHKQKGLAEANPLISLVPETGVEPATFALRMRGCLDALAFLNLYESIQSAA